MNEILPKSATIPESDYVIIGGTGDLALRKIFPALFWRCVAGQITPDFRLLVAARHVMSKQEFSKMLRPFCAPALASVGDTEAVWDGFMALIQLVILDVKTGEGAAEFAAKIHTRIADDRPLIFYLAITPSLFGDTCRRLKAHGLALPQSRLVVEKPLGHDGVSAREINSTLLDVFDETQIYRIDHYLGKETVQNLMALRFANTIFESQWGNHAIDHVQITVAETVGINGRTDYYDNYGAIRDMVQNHLLQLVCLVAMQPPPYFTADQVRDEKLRVLQAIRPLQRDDVVRGQYKAGVIDGKYASSYLDDLGAASSTETFVAMRLGIDTWRWAGVPFYLRTGKRLTKRASEIILTFKHRPHDIFRAPSKPRGEDVPNRLIIRLQPQEGLRLLMTSKAPGPGGMRLFPSELNLSFGDTFEQRVPDAYERLLMDMARGNQTLFMRHDEVLAAWDIIDPVVKNAHSQNLHHYDAGSMGPQAASSLMVDTNHAWIDPHIDDKAVE